MRARLRLNGNAGVYTEEFCYSVESYRSHIMSVTGVDPLERPARLKRKSWRRHMWIGGVLPSRDAMRVEVSDRDRFVEKGFDVVTSFRGKSR